MRPPAPNPKEIISCMSLRGIELLKGKAPPYVPHKGAVLVQCPLCSDQMYLGPAQKLKHETESTPMACMVCCIALGAKPENTKCLTNKKAGE